MAATLIGLPAEIRLLILEDLLVSTYISEDSNKPEVWPYADKDAIAAEEHRPLHPQILRTCRKLHTEGIALLYSKNSFCIHTPHANCDDDQFDGLGQAQTFLRGIGQFNASLVRRMTVGEGSAMLESELLQGCFELASGLMELTLIALGPRCSAPYSFMLQYYLNIQAAVKGSATLLTQASSVVPHGFIPEGFSIIQLKFHRGGVTRQAGELEVELAAAIVHFRGKVHEQEREWQKLGWNLPMMVETTSGAVTFI
ncbi:hypothetical protein TWF696_002809 [Orbilia brochopaga]|uniref:Uncharacterized protein n=1 Tax=Orbilia brochopaga TaxID=3140254 RepID=A0AAV9U234_9PEZI